MFLHRNVNQVAVYSTSDYQLQRRYSITGLEPRIHNDIVSCVENKCFYISDSDGSRILRCNLSNDKPTATTWPVSDTPCGLSVTPGCRPNLLVTCRGEPNKLVELNIDSGQSVREIALQSDIVDPWHGVQLTTGQYVVSHGSRLSDLHRVCVVDADGNVTRNYDGHECPDTLSCPCHLAVDEDTQFTFVADHANDRIVGLGPQFTHFFIRGLTGPWRLYLGLHEKTRRLYVGHWTDGVTVIYL